MLTNPIFIASDVASIWLPSAENLKGSAPAFDTIENVAIPLLSPPLEEFFFGSLPRIIHQHQANVPWHFNPLCRGCQFESKCRDRSIKEGRFGSMPDISLADVAVLHELQEHAKELGQETSKETLTDLEDLDRICRDAGLFANLAKNYPLSTRKAHGILRLSKKSASLKLFGSPKISAAMTNRPQASD